MTCDSCGKFVTKVTWVKADTWVCSDCLPEKKRAPVSFGNKGLTNPFEWWHAPTSMAAMAKKAEADGATKRDPKLARYLEMRLKNLKKKEHPVYDYQKLGHPIMRKQTE